jgi:hypothetical protein
MEGRGETSWNRYLFAVTFRGSENRRAGPALRIDGCCSRSVYAMALNGALYQKRATADRAHHGT